MMLCMYLYLGVGGPNIEFETGSLKFSSAKQNRGLLCNKNDPPWQSGLCGVMAAKESMTRGEGRCHYQQ